MSIIICVVYEDYAPYMCSLICSGQYSWVRLLICSRKVCQKYLWKSDILIKEVVYLTVGNPAFSLAFYLAGVHFWGKLKHAGHVGEQKSIDDESELEK